MLDDRGAVGVAHEGGDDVIGVVVVVIAHEITGEKVKCQFVKV